MTVGRPADGQRDGGVKDSGTGDGGARGGQVASPGQGGRKVLVVDDDPIFRSVCKLVLARSGYTVLTAGGGEEGLAIARAERPDVIILDFMMSSPTEGQEVAFDVKEDPALQGVPVLMVTSVGSQHPWWQVRPDGAELPVEGWLDKPVRPEQLLAEVARVLASAKV